MAEARENGEKTVVIPAVPTAVTVIQVIAVILTLAAARYSRDVVAPLLLGVLAAMALAPLVRGISRFMPRGIAAKLRKQFIPPSQFLVQLSAGDLNRCGQHGKRLTHNHAIALRLLLNLRHLLYALHPFATHRRKGGGLGTVVYC